MVPFDSEFNSVSGTSHSANRVLNSFTSSYQRFIPMNPLLDAPHVCELFHVDLLSFFLYGKTFQDELEIKKTKVNDDNSPNVTFIYTTIVLTGLTSKCLIEFN